MWAATLCVYRGGVSLWLVRVWSVCVYCGVCVSLWLVCVCVLWGVCESVAGPCVCTVGCVWSACTLLHSELVAAPLQTVP